MKQSAVARIQSASSVLTRQRQRTSALARRVADVLGGQSDRDHPPEPDQLDGDGDGDDWWDMLPFTTHRIQLTDGVATMADGVGTDVSTDVRSDLVSDLAAGIEPWSMLDLGSAEGGFTIEAARRGASSALGLEARESHVKRAKLAAKLAHVPAATFEVADINERLSRCEPTNIVLATGILYHVGDPAATLAAIRRCTVTALVLDTHIADRSVITHDCSDATTMTSSTGSTYEGRWYREYEVVNRAKDQSELIWAAWDEERAFWPFEDQLVAMLRNAGFSQVDKVDTEGWPKSSRWYVDPTNRVMYIARP